MIQSDLEQYYFQYLLSLSDIGFVNLTRNYLNTEDTSSSRIKTIETLILFLKKEATVEAIYSLLDREDTDFLTITACYPENNINYYQAFFYQKTPLEVETKLLNLQERLLIFYSRESNSYQLNPYLEKIYTKLNVFEVATLFYAKTSTHNDNSTFFINNAILNAYLTFLFGNGKKSLLSQMFSQLSLIHHNFLEECYKNFTIISKNNFTKNNIIKFFQLSIADKIATLVAIYSSKKTQDQTNISWVIKQLFMHYSNKTINESLIHRLYFLKTNQLIDQTIVSKLLTSPLFNSSNEGYHILKIEDQATNGSVIIENNFSLHLMPDSPCLLSITLSSNIDKFDTMSLYAINQESFFNFLSYDFTVDDFIEDLKDYKNMLNDSFISTLKHWQEHYRSIRLYQGYILKLNQDKELLLKQNDFFKEQVCTQLAEGIYLLKEEPCGEFANFLTNLGLTNTKAYSPTLLTFNFDDDKLINLEDSKYVELAPKSIIIDDTNKISMELAYRIKRKVIIFNEQLSYPTHKLEEVSPFDHQAKIRILKSAIERGLLAELDTIKDIDIITHLVKPISIEKGNNNYIVHAVNYKNSQPISFGITSLSSIRLLESSLIN